MIIDLINEVSMKPVFFCRKQIHDSLLFDTAGAPRSAEKAVQLASRSVCPTAGKFSASSPIM
jgi:hypothetical protein